MNEFVNFGNRGIELPAGCKDLIDVLPPPRKARMPVEGFAHIERYLSRLSQSPAKRRSIIIWSLDYREHVRISHTNGVLKLMILVDKRDNSREQSVLKLFRDAGIPPTHDADGHADGIPLRALLYPLPPLVPNAADLIRAVLQEVYRLPNHAALQFEYHKRDAN